MNDSLGYEFDNPIFANGNGAVGRYCIISKKFGVGDWRVDIATNAKNEKETFAVELSMQHSTSKSNARGKDLCWGFKG